MTQNIKTIPSYQRNIPTFVFTIALSLLLAVGFIPTSREFFRLLFRTLSSSEPAQGISHLAFPLLALVFYLSMPKLKCGLRPHRLSELIQISVLPVLIALGFGVMTPGRLTLSDLMFPGQRRLEFLWLVLSIPLGEELLFRGWLYQLLDRRWPGLTFSLTCPFPAALWLSSLGFSLWHLQNLGTVSTGFVLFQVLYTFFTGLWLGYLRWRSDSLVLPITFHTLINLVSVVV